MVHLPHHVPGYLPRVATAAALTANAVRPVPGFRAGIASFAAGMPTGELAPHLLALTAADAAYHAQSAALREHNRSALLLAGAAAGGLGWSIAQSLRARGILEAALEEGLGADYATQLEDAPSPAEVAAGRRSAWRGLINPFRLDRSGLRVERDIAYADHGRRGLLDVFFPADGPVEGAPVLLQIHGGAWAAGRKDQQGQPLMAHLAARGWVCVAPNYRLSPRSAWPDHIVDVKQVIAWIRRHIGSYGGDPDYIAITGGSAGGHLASLAALTPNDPAFQPGFEDEDTTVQVALPHYGVYDLAGETGTVAATRMRDKFLAPQIMQRRWDAAPDVFRDASPLLRIGPDAPDMFVVHGRADTVVPVDQARTFVARLREISHGSVVYAELPGAQHAFDVLPSIRSLAVVDAVETFLHWHWAGHRAARA